MAIYQLGDKRVDLGPLGEDGRPTSWIAPSADVIGDVRLGDEASVWFGAVLRGDNEPIAVGARSNVQDNSVLHTDPGCPVEIGADVTIGHKVILHGARIGDGALIGMGSVILNRAVIGAECLVGANALVTEGKVFEPGWLIMGAPAKPVRQLSDEERARRAVSAKVYVARAKEFAASLALDPRDGAAS